MSDTLTGGCFCREIRYEITGSPAMHLYCFCKDCLAITGTDGYAGFMVNDSDFRLVEGMPSTHTKISKSGRSVKRHFCGNCGSNHWGQTELGLVSVAAGSLDDPSVFEPSKKVFAAEAPCWARIPDELEEM